MTDHTHTYSTTIAVPLSGSDRHMSAAKAAIAPIIDKAVADIAALGHTPKVEDKTVRVRGTKEVAPDPLPMTPIAPGAVELATDAPVGVGGAAHETPTERPHRTPRAAE
jgi:hypothetical protein